MEDGRRRRISAPWRCSPQRSFYGLAVLLILSFAVLLLLLFLPRTSNRQSGGSNPSNPNAIAAEPEIERAVDGTLIQTWNIDGCRPVMVRTDVEDELDSSTAAPGRQGGCLPPFYTLGPPLSYRASPCPPESLEFSPPNGGIVKCCDDEIVALTLDSQVYGRRFLQEDEVCSMNEIKSPCVATRQ